MAKATKKAKGEHDVIRDLRKALKSGKPPVFPNGLESFWLEGRNLASHINSVGGLVPAMAYKLNCGHVKDPRLAELFQTVYSSIQEAQSILHKQGVSVQFGVS